MELLKKFDRGIARGEAAIITVLLVTMVLSATVSAFFRFLSTRLELDFANVALSNLEWVPPLLQKGTLWLAFLGASLATREDRHIGVDLVPRLLPKKGKLLVRGITNLAAAAVSWFLARAFWGAVQDIARSEGQSMMIYGDQGQVHLCDASARALEAATMDAPAVFCALRTGFEALGIPVQTPAAAFQMIVPVMFVLLAVRLIANGIGSFVSLATGKGGQEGAAEEEKVGLTVSAEIELPGDDDEDDEDDAPSAGRGSRSEGAPSSDERPPDAGPSDGADDDEDEPASEPRQEDAPSDEEE